MTRQLTPAEVKFAAHNGGRLPCRECNGTTLIDTVHGPVRCTAPLCDDGTVRVQGVRLHC